MAACLAVPAALLVALAAGPASAEVSPRSGSSQAVAPRAGDRAVPVRLTLADAISRGIDASHRLAEFRSREEGARAAAAGRSASGMPQFSAQAGYSRTNHVTAYGIKMPGQPLQIIYPDVPDNYRTRLDLQWPIYTGGRVDALVTAAEAEVKATGQDLAAARADLKLEIARAFWSVVTSREALRVVQESLTRMDAYLRDARNRYGVGLLAPNDVLSIEAQHLRQQLLLIEARNLAEQAETELRRVVGLEPDTPVEVVATLDEPSAPAMAADLLVAEARSTRAERQALVERISAAGARTDAAAASRLPVVAFGAGFDYLNPNPKRFPREDRWQHSWDVTVNVSWMLWDFGRTKADVAEATSARHLLEARLRDMDRLLDAEVRQRRLDLESALAAVPAARAAVDSAAEARRVAMDRFKAGLATSTETLDAQVAGLQAELDRTRVLAAIKLAEARLERALGR